MQGPVKPGSQPAASWSLGRPAGRPGSCTAAPPGRQTFLGLASEQPPGRRAGPLARQASRQLPERGRPGSRTAPGAGQPQSYLGRQYRKNYQTPEKMIERKPRPRKKNGCGRLASQPQQPARRPTGFPPSSLPGGWLANWTTIDPSALSGTSHPTGRPGATASRHQPASQLAIFM